MKVIVYTSVWSLALRRDGPSDSAHVQELRHLIEDHCVQMIGPIRQRLLSGLRYENQYEVLKERLDAFLDLQIITDDYVSAAKYFNFCRSRGIQDSDTDFFNLRCGCQKQACHLYDRQRFLPLFKTPSDGSP